MPTTKRSARTASLVRKPLAVAREELVVSRRKVERGRVRVRTSVRMRKAAVAEPILHEDVDVRRVPINRVVEKSPGIRTEGDVLIIPVLEEVAVVRKQLVLKEELRVTRRRRQVVHRETVVLREEQARVERIRNRKGND